MIKIRNYEPGDEISQVTLYNQAGAAMAKFKPATVGEVQRRIKARDFDPTTRFYADDQGKILGYCQFDPSGRISFPWTAPGEDRLREPLFQAVLTAMKQRGIRRALAAYREDWPSVHQFFLKHGFQKTRDMVNFIIDLLDMPTPAARPSTSYSPLMPEDVPAMLELAPGLLRLPTADALQRYLFNNPYFPADSLFVLRSRTEKALIAVGILITDSSYADPKVVDSSMPCFRLGAMGTEGLSAKRIKGLFSFLARQDANLNILGMDLLGQASFRLRDLDDIDALAAQAPSDVPGLLNFYTRNFRRQGSFPVFERDV